MSSFSGIKKYYIGLVVMVVFAAGIVGYTIASGSDAKSDKKTSEAITKISMALDTYTNKYSAIPTDLNQLDVEDIPSTISYKKLSEEKYKICATYKAAAGGFDGGLFSLFGGALYGSAMTTAVDYPANDYYLDTYKLGYAHKKGENCQTVTPYGAGYDTAKSELSSYDPSTTDYGSSTPAPQYPSVCDKSGTGFTMSDKGTITAINPTDRTITLDIESSTKPSDIEFDEITKAYDKSCAEMKIGTLKAGDKVKFYGYTMSALVDVIELQ